MAYTPRQLKQFMFLWPPYLGAGVRIREFDNDGSRIVVTHKPNKITKNALGTAFGGTLASMTDPFYVLAGITRLGKAYKIWDTETDVKFLKPGRGKLTADMRIDDQTYDLIQEKTADGSKYLHWHEVDITDEQGDTVATVRKQVYYRLKQR